MLEGTNELTISGKILGQATTTMGSGTLMPGSHGMFISEYSTMSDSCSELGTFVQDLPQLTVSPNGTAAYSHVDNHVTLFGNGSVAGRGIVITALTDDMDAYYVGAAEATPEAGPG